MVETEYDTRLGAYTLPFDDAGRVLLVRWTGGAEPMWTAPGGGVFLDEDPADGLVREVREETGLDIEVGPLAGVRTGLLSPISASAGCRFGSSDSSTPRRSSEAL